MEIMGTRLTVFKDCTYLFIFRGRGRKEGRQRHIYVRGKHQWVASRMCQDEGPNLQPRHRP